MSLLQRVKDRLRYGKRLGIWHCPVCHTWWGPRAREPVYVHRMFKREIVGCRACCSPRS